MGTRYNVGDAVEMTETRFAGEDSEVVDIEDRDTDSPTYILSFKGSVGRETVEAKASEMKKLSPENDRKMIVEAIYDAYDKEASYEFAYTFSSEAYQDGLDQRYDLEEGQKIETVAESVHHIGVMARPEEKEAETPEEAIEAETSENWEKITGLRMRSYEAEVSTRAVIDRVVEDIGADRERIKMVLEERFDPYEMDGVSYWTTSGEVHVFKESYSKGNREI